MILSAALSLLPSLLVWIPAGVLALVRFEKHPTASVLLLVAGVISLMTHLASVLLPQVLTERGMAMSQMSWVFTAMGLVGTVGLACLVAAVFVERDSAKNGPPTLPR